MSYALGIDLGGTSIKAVAVTPDGETLVQRVVPFVDEKMEWAEKVRALVRDFQQQLDRAAEHIGISAPGLAASRFERRHIATRLHGHTPQAARRRHARARFYDTKFA